MTTRRTALALGLFAIVGAVLALYYWAHKPITPALALAFVQSFANLAVALILVLAAGGVGRRLLDMLFGAGSDLNMPGAGSVVEVTLGWGAIGLGMLLLGALRLYYPIAAWALAGLLLFVLRRDIGAWLLATAQLARALAPAGRLERVAAGFSVLVLAFGLMRALAPPVTWDALVYHLTLPALYARTHGIQVNPADFSVFSGMPQLTEMLYTAAGLLRVDPSTASIAAQTLGWFIGAFLCLGLAGSARDMGLPAWVAPAILFSSLSIALELAWAYSDLLLMLLALAVVLALRQWRTPRVDGRADLRWLGLAGIFAGLACGCKYTGVIVPLAGVAVVVAGELSEGQGARRGRLVRALRSAVYFALLAGAAFAPWLLKNWLLTGSPFYPLLWPAADMDALRLWFYNRPDQAQPLLQAAVIFLRATFFGVQSGNEIDATLGPLFLLCAGLLAFEWRVLTPQLRRDLAWLLLFVAAAYFGWVLLAHYSALAHQARLFFAFLPALALLGAAGLAGVGGLNTPALRLSLVVNAAFGLVLGLSATEVVAEFVSQNPLPYLAGTQSAADYVAAQLGWYQPAIERVNALPAGSRVVFLWEARSLACTSSIQCIPDVVIDRWWHARRTLGSAEPILAQWRAEGATHVLIYDTGAGFIQSSPNNAYDPADWTELDRLRAQLQLVGTFGDAYRLYAVP
jgi:hypothetical protein